MPKSTGPNGNVPDQVADQTGSQDQSGKPDIFNKRAVMETSLGSFTLEFYPQDAPKAVENFLGLAQKGYYDGVTFHRVVKGFVVQAGDPTGTGRGGESFFGGAFEDELNPTAASYQAGYQKGVLAMANRGPHTNTSQFFIMLADTPLDHLYTIFGKVVAGQDVVDKIGMVAIDPKTDKPVEPVVIKRMKVEDE
ncbi:MAG: peptidylprolyl isomerase [Candidatus Doudnabacteria bacterium]|nr:peptidylprolyl isomerase [Candidatus Doudnabacteria bacterium]